MNDFKIYNLSVPGIDNNMFKHPFYNENKCKKIAFNGLIKEQEIITKNGNDYISLAPKFKPHSDYEMMLQSTDSICKCPVTSLTDEAVQYIFETGYKYIKFLSDSNVINKYGLKDGYPYLVFNYDEFTTDRHSGMSEKPFHLHLNSWTSNSIGNISEIDKKNISKYYYESVVDPIFDITKILAREALECDELNKYIESVDINCGNQGIDYSSIYKIKGGWKFIQTEEFAYVLKIIHHQLEKRYVEILNCFSGKTTIPKLYTRHQLFKKEVIQDNIEKSNMQDETKISLINLIPKVRNITPEQFKKISENIDERDSVIPLRWLAYSLGLFSNSYIDENKPYYEKTLYMNVTPRLFTKIGGASIMNFPKHALVKIDRGMGNIDNEYFEKRVEFHQDFAKTL